jgi:sn-glycerol 3-phosphate transport system substrate-binding protein
MKLFGFVAGIAATLSLLSSTSAFAATQISWWHAMTGANAEVVDKIAKEFNASQSDYELLPVFKGTYPETLNAGIAAFRAGQAPDIIQVFDVGTGVMMAAEGAIKPVADVLTSAGMTFDKSQYLPGIVGYYSKPDGTMLSFPYNSSSPILYYNKDIFQKAGLDVNNPPKTWNEVWEDAKKIKTSGAAACGYTSTWLTWIHLEAFAAWNNVPYGTNQNGLAGTDVELKINAPIFVKHFQAIADLAKDGTFKYGGRTSEAKQLFLAGECGILTESSGGLGDIVKSGMNYGIGQLPYDRRCQGRAAEHHAWRRQPLGLRQQERRGIQGRCGVLPLSVEDRSAGACTRCRATCRSRWLPTRPPRSPASTTRTLAARHRSCR